MNQKRLYRSRGDRMLTGVCAGLGDFFGLDPTVVRLVFVLGVVLGFGSMGFLYLVLWIIVPEEPPIGMPPTNPPETPANP
jgi:phage shock protein C